MHRGVTSWRLLSFVSHVVAYDSENARRAAAATAATAAAAAWCCDKISNDDASDDRWIGNVGGVAVQA